jgi:type II secretory pathway pseudopilin PulG
MNRGLHIKHRKRGFILLEVIISLIIVSVTIAAILRSFSISIRGASNAEIATIGSILAEQLLDTYEIQMPEEDEVTNDFSEDGFPNYYYEVTFEEEPVDYPHIRLENKVDEFNELIKITINVYYDNGQRNVYRAAELVSYVMPFEKFTYASRKENGFY